jgi:protein-S-isoprenylcysteine O-methyltransferase Ste14
MYRAVLTLAWFAGTVYATIPLFWLMVHPFAARLRARRFPLLIIVPAWFLMIAAICIATWPWHEAVFYHAPAAWVVAGLLFAAAVFIYQRAHLNFSHAQVMGRSEIEPRGEQRLVTGGIRQHIRHPIYLGHLCVLLGLAVGSGEIVLYVLTIFALLTGWPMIQQEEAELQRRFGEEYRAYQRAVPARLLPHVFRRAKQTGHPEKLERN